MSCMAPSVVYLGHHISADKIHPADGKNHAIEDAPRPQNVGQLRWLVSLLINYGMFLTNMANILAPLMGQTFTILIINVAAAESAIGIAILVAYYRVR